MARTINSPGVEVKEYDLSERATLQAGTVILVQGFASQGPTNELIQITSADELNDIYFGGMGPTNPAERYFYHACMQVMRSPATLQTIRLPYGDDSGDEFTGERVAICLYGKPSYQKNPYIVEEGAPWSLVNQAYDYDDEGAFKCLGLVENFYHFVDTLENVSNLSYNWGDLAGKSDEEVCELFGKEDDPNAPNEVFLNELMAFYNNFRYDGSLRRLIPGQDGKTPYFVESDDGGMETNGEVTFDLILNDFLEFVKKFYEFYADDEMVITEARPYVLSEKDYQDIKLGAIDHYDEMPDAVLEALSPTLQDMVRTSVPKAPGRDSGLQMIIINKLRTTVDDNLQGFYLAVTDNYPYALWDSDGQDEVPLTSAGVYPEGYVNPTDIIFDEDIWYLTQPEGDENGRCGVNAVNEGLLNFTHKKLAKEVLNRPSDMFGNDDFRSCLGLSTLRIVHDMTSSNPDGLDCSYVAFAEGSLNKDATHVDRSGYGKTSFFIDNYAPIYNPYTEVITLKSAQRATKVRFDFTPGLDPANHLGREGKHGFVVSLGVVRDCENKKENRHIGNLLKKVSNALSLIDNTQKDDLDIVLDAGLSTIWAYCSVKGLCWNGLESKGTRETSLYGGAGAGNCEFDDTVYIAETFMTRENESIPCLKNHGGDSDGESPLYQAWFDVFEKFNTFCKDTRKDCIFISDPLRSIFVRGQGTEAEELIGYNFTTYITKPMKSLYDGRNSNFACTYANWASIHDDYASMDVWMPPSIFVAPIMAIMDSNYWPWYAPFGLNNGLLTTVKDIACRPNQGQCDTLYKMGCNMFVYFNGDGYVVWGQKTLQYKQSAFDRINVRRLFLYLERATVKAVRYYIGEPNTSYTRNRVTSTLAPIFDTCKSNSGCYDYRIVCDESNNTPEVIDANEMVVDIYIKPVRIAEFILVNFYATKTSTNFEELLK